MWQCNQMYQTRDGDQQGCQPAGFGVELVYMLHWASDLGPDAHKGTTDVLQTLCRQLHPFNPRYIPTCKTAGHVDGYWRSQKSTWV